MKHSHAYSNNGDGKKGKENNASHKHYEKLSNITGYYRQNEKACR